MPVVRHLIFVISLFISLNSYASGGGATTSPYLELNPPFIVNVNDGDNVRHMQVRVQLKLSKPELASEIEYHKPAIRHEMTMLLSSKSVSEVSSIKGKENLRAEALTVLQKVMQENTGETAIEAVYFTEFIIQ